MKWMLARMAKPRRRSLGGEAAGKWNDVRIVVRTRKR
jgi:hypothetical protein